MQRGNPEKEISMMIGSEAHTPESSAALVALWNTNYPPGSSVLVVFDDGRVVITGTKSMAQTSAGIGPYTEIFGAPYIAPLNRVIPVPALTPGRP